MSVCGYEKNLTTSGYVCTYNTRGYRVAETFEAGEPKDKKLTKRKIKCSNIRGTHTHTHTP